jgi:hypothetical protein
MAQTSYPAVSGNRLMPASPTALKPLILDALRDGPLRRKELFHKLRTLAPAFQFFFEGAQGESSAKRALAELKNDGRIFSPQPKYWQIRDSDTQLEAQVEGELDDEIDDDNDEGDDDEGDESLEVMEVDTAAGIKIERMIGEGAESVYVYYHDVYAEIAKRDGLAVWECKVGSTTSAVDNRIIGQGALTCFPRPPIIGLVIRTDNARSLERLLHSALTLAGKRITAGGGSEWFLTSPDHLERWHEAYLGTISILRDCRESQPQAGSKQ